MIIRQACFETWMRIGRAFNLRSALAPRLALAREHFRAVTVRASLIWTPGKPHYIADIGIVLCVTLLPAFPLCTVSWCYHRLTPSCFDIARPDCSLVQPLACQTPRWFCSAGAIPWKIYDDCGGGVSWRQRTFLPGAGTGQTPGAPPRTEPSSVGAAPSGSKSQPLWPSGRRTLQGSRRRRMLGCWWHTSVAPALCSEDCVFLKHMQSYCKLTCLSLVFVNNLTACVVSIADILVCYRFAVIFNPLKPKREWKRRERKWVGNARYYI
jgi:hypothetical protein